MANNMPLRGAKFGVFEGGIRTNAFVWAPGLLPHSGQYDGLVHVVDWYVCVISIAEVEFCLHKIIRTCARYRDRKVSSDIATHRKIKKIIANYEKITTQHGVGPCSVFDSSSTYAICVEDVQIYR